MDVLSAVVGCEHDTERMATLTHIRQAVEGSLQTLGLERIDLYQLHRIDPAVPVEETMGVFGALRDEGKIRRIGLSEVGVEEIERARAVVEIATVQNVYNLAIRQHDDVLAYCQGLLERRAAA